jgi:hypothetical protein
MATTANAGQAQAQVALAPFRAGTQWTLTTDGYTNSTALGSSTTDLPDYTPSPNNYLRGLYLSVQATGSNGSGNTVAYSGDGPLNVFSSVTFQDANSKPIVGPVDSYTLAVVNKYGGYMATGDPRASANYAASTGTGTTAGSFTFVLFVPVEVVQRGFGALQNQSSDSTFTLKLTLNTTGNVFNNGTSAAPSSSCTVKTVIHESGWWKGNTSGAAQTPPAAGTTQYWTRGTYNSLNGSQQIQISQGLGYPIRGLAFINYDVSANTRATGQTDFPDPAQLIYKGTSYWNVSKLMWDEAMSRNYGFTSTTFDTANGLENGVFALFNFMQDIDKSPGNETAIGYLNTNQGDLHQFIGSFSGNSKMYVLANYVATVGAYSSVQGKV